MNHLQSIVLCAPVRIAIGAYAGTLRDTPATYLGASVICAAVVRAGLDGIELSGVVLGQVVQAGAKMNPARRASIHADAPVGVPALTINRVCGSGAQAIVSGYRMGDATAYDRMLRHRLTVSLRSRDRQDDRPVQHARSGSSAVRHRRPWPCG